PDEWLALVRSPNLRPTHLTIGGYTRVPAEAIRELLDAPWVADLRDLILNHEEAEPRSLGRLFRRPPNRSPRLRSLRLPPVEETIRELADWPGLSSVAELYASNYPGEVTAELLRSPHLTCRLKRLDVTSACRADAAVTSLARNPAMRGLQWLGFGY